MGYYVPAMQQQYTGYDSGRNTARNLLDAVRMKNQKEATDRSLDIAETQAANTQELFKQQQATRSAINQAMKGQAKTRLEQEKYKKRMEKSGEGATLPYKMAQWISDYVNPFTETKEARVKRESGAPMDYRVNIDDFEDPNVDLRSIYPFLFGPENLLQRTMMQQQQPAYTQQLNYNPATGTYE
tara:strand:- start:260 stop:811 length:552 start_codon:yes stop_codon:yes gene_type:complete